VRDLGWEVEVLDSLNQGDDRPQQLSNLVDRRLEQLFLKAKVFFIFGHNNPPNQELKINREGLGDAENFFIAQKLVESEL
jgi:hypothetical protein